jgi:Ca2+-binding RTX toxin-like protein
VATRSLDPTRLQDARYPSQRIDPARLDLANNGLRGGVARSSIGRPCGDNSLTGGTGGDILRGLGGNDILTGGAGLDRLFGGDGNDTLVIAAASDLVAGEVYQGGAGTDTLRFAGANASADLSDVRIYSVENLDGFTDGVGLKANQLTHFTGTIDTGAIALTSAGWVDVSVANLVSPNIELSSLGPNTVTLADSSAIAHVVDGGAATDVVMVIGAAGLGVTVHGNGGDDRLDGGAGADVLSGNAGVDRLRGGGGDDTLTGGAGFDKVYADGGNDTLVIGAASDLAAKEIYDGGDGSDTLQFLNADAAVDLSNVLIYSIENLTGFADGVSMTLGQLARFTGMVDSGEISLSTPGKADLSAADIRSQTINLSSAGNNILTIADSAAVSHIVDGGSAIDAVTVTGSGMGVSLFGFAGDDRLLGGGGNDWLDGGLGADTLAGGGPVMTPLHLRPARPTATR